MYPVIFFPQNCGGKMPLSFPSRKTAAAQCTLSFPSRKTAAEKCTLSFPSRKTAATKCPCHSRPAKLRRKNVRYLQNSCSICHTA